MSCYNRCAWQLDRLRQKYPSQFSGQSISLAWPAGWHSIVQEACARAAEGAPDLRWMHIKEKFGALSMAFEISPRTRGRCRLVPAKAEQTAQALEVAKTACKVSLSTCMVCGRPGSEFEIDGWIETTCQSCRDLQAAFRAPWRLEGSAGRPINREPREPIMRGPLMLTVEQAANQLRVGPLQLLDQAAAGHWLALHWRWEIRFPYWQFMSEQHAQVARAAIKVSLGTDVMTPELLAEVGWQAYLLSTLSNGALGGMSPLQLVDAGRVDLALDYLTKSLDRD